MGWASGGDATSSERPFYKNRLLVILTCVHEQARQGTDQLHGQGGQNEVQVQRAGLGEGVLQAEQEE